MSKKKQDELLSSNYDGIQEYDNDLPRWWVVLFWLTIVFGVVYAGYTHLGFGKSPVDSMNEELAAIAKLKPKISPVDSASADALFSLLKDKTSMEAGKASYVAKCAVCHGAAGEGTIGPNLADDYWIHGGTMNDIHRVIEQGVLDKGMLAWKGVLPDKEINEVSAYVYSLRGTNPTNPKAPQGEKISEQEEGKN